MPLTPFPPAPSRASPATFATLADAWVAHLTSTFTAEMDLITGSLDSVVASVPALVPPVAEYLMTGTGCAGAAATGTAGAANRIELYPFTPRNTFNCDRLSVNVTTGVASAQGKLLVYNSNTLGQPNGLILETAALDFSVTAIVEATVALTFTKGVNYWLGVRHSSTASLSAFSNGAAPDINGGTLLSVALRKSLRRTLAFGTVAPSSWVFASSEINAALPSCLWLRRSA